MNINKLFENKEYLNSQIDFFKSKKQIRKIEYNLDLIIAHFQKAKHNFEFFSLNEQKNEYSDWLIVTLYYSLYHACLSLINKKGYDSKNHSATILILIKEYTITIDEVNLIEELSINKQDAYLYSNLKEERHNASYSTGIKFNSQLISSYKLKVLKFLNKVEEIIEI